MLHYATVPMVFRRCRAQLNAALACVGHALTARHCCHYYSSARLVAVSRWPVRIASAALCSTALQAAAVTTDTATSFSAESLRNAEMAGKSAC